MTADEFLKDRELIGALMVYNEFGITYRGPIAEISCKRGIITIKLRWVEVPDSKNELWHRSSGNPLVIAVAKDFFVCSINEKGQLTFAIPHLGSVKVTKLASLSPQMQDHMKQP